MGIRNGIMFFLGLFIVFVGLEIIRESFKEQQAESKNEIKHKMASQGWYVVPRDRA